MNLIPIEKAQLIAFHSIAALNSLFDSRNYLLANTQKKKKEEDQTLYRHKMGAN